MLEKNRSKRPNIEEVMNHDWMAKYKKVNERGAGGDNFKAYSMTNPASPKIQQEIKDVKARME